MIGATHALSDAAFLNEYLISNKINTNVVVIPATVDGNIRHNYCQTSLGFDTASKFYS